MPNKQNKLPYWYYSAGDADLKSPSKTCVSVFRQRWCSRHSPNETNFYEVAISFGTGPEMRISYTQNQFHALTRESLSKKFYQKNCKNMPTRSTNTDKPAKKVKGCCGPFALWFMDCVVTKKLFTSSWKIYGRCPWCYHFHLRGPLIF